MTPGPSRRLPVMSLVRWNVSMSLDGFIAGPDDAMDWVFGYDDPNPVVDEFISSTGSILIGRRSYDVGRKPDQIKEATEAFGGAWHGPQFVLTHRPPDDETDPTITFLSGAIGPAVATARAAAGDKNVLVIGAALGREILEAGLMDDITVLVVPILLGDGIRLFGSPPAAPAPLELVDTSRAGQITNLHYRVTK
jgi:dihydrofolate reductase